VGNVGERAADKTILVVDDEEGIRESVREILSDEGYRVVDIADATRVLELIRKERPRLLLLDIWMPQVDGIGLLKEIKEQQPDIPVIMISGHGNIHTAVAAIKLGAFDFIEKPLSLEGLLLTVRRALGEPPQVETGKQERRRPRRKGRSRSSDPLSLDRSLGRRRQKTLKKSVVISGQGLHSGIKTGLILHPLSPNSGILFSGISGEETIPAHLDYVGSTGYATSLRGKGIVVRTVEHFLAVLHSYGIAASEREMADECGTGGFFGTTLSGMIRGLGRKLPAGRDGVEAGILSIGELAALKRPVLTVVRTSIVRHWVVVDSVGETRVSIRCPAGGRMDQPLADFESTMSGPCVWLREPAAGSPRSSR